MSQLPVQFLEQGLHRVLFDAMPMPVLVVDADLCVLEYNSAAARLLGTDKRQVLRRRGGDVLHCVHAGETADGCGRSAACPDCVIRQSVQAAADGEHVRRRWAPLELHSHGERSEVNVRVSAHPFQYERQAYILLLLEGLNE
jgi:PAS domain-containing protein